MAISIKCGECQSPYSVAENLLGKSIKCKSCGAMIVVAAPASPVARPVVAKAIPAKPAAVVDDDDDPRPAKASRRSRSDDDDESPRGKRSNDEPKKKSGLPLVLGGLVGLVVLAAVAVGGLYAAGMLGKDDRQGDIANVNPSNRMDPPGRGGDTLPSMAPSLDPSVKPVTTPPTTPQLPPVITPTLPPSPKPKDPQPGTGKTREQMMRGDLDEATTALAAKATLLVEGEGTNGERWTGTAWFGLEPGLVFTNAHVLNMTAPDSKPPAKLTFHMYKPDPNNGARVMLSRTIPHSRIKILGVDRRNDIAVLRIDNETDLPTPLKVRPSSGLQVRQGVTTLGFPLTSRIASISDLSKDQQPEMSVRPSTVTSFRQDALGRPSKVQIEGGVNSGNSGGPIVDAEGYVVAVVVAVVLGQDGTQTQLALAVPTEYVFGLTAGRIDDLEFDTAYKKDGMIRVPVSVKCLDPMKKLNKIGIGYWVGDTQGAIRSPGSKKPEKLPADLDHQFVDFKYDSETKKATGELVLPELIPGRSYWAQGFYTNALLPEGYWTPGTKINLNGPPVERVPTDLIAKFPKGVVRPIELSNSSDLSEFEEGEGQTKEERVKIVTSIKMTEGIGQGNASAGSAATLGFKYQSLELKAQRGNRELTAIPKKLLDLFNQAVVKVEARASVNPRGEIFNYNTDTRALPNPVLAAYMKIFSDEVLESLLMCSIPLPNKKVDPLEKWESKHTKRVFLNTEVNADDLLGPGPGTGAPTTPRKVTIRELKYEQKVTYTYLGTRQRLGTNEAVVRIDGIVTPAAGSRELATGHIKGYANIELETGSVVFAEIDSEFEVDSSTKGLRKKVSGVSSYKLTRGSSVK